MRKLYLIIVLAFFQFGCTKENTTTATPCNCGIIISDNVQDYSVMIRNDCSGIVKLFYLNQGDWMNAYVGKNFCITNVTRW